ncbi:MAG: nucleotidyltransferase domain-containing protein [Polyangiaceae bacterium]
MSRFELFESVFARSGVVAAAWVFGSVARGDARPDSDLDVAVLLSDPAATAVTHRRELFELAALLESTSQRHVDLVILTLHDPIIAHRVLSEGVLVHDADPRRRVDFTADAIARYLDWAPKYEAAAARSLKSNRAWAHGEGR